MNHSDSADPSTNNGRLLVVLAAPPTTSGRITLARVEMARQHLGYSEVEIVNLFPLPVLDVTELSAVGGDSTTWIDGRPSILAKLTGANAALLAYGITSPTGTARTHHVAQLDWLESAFAQSKIDVVITYGGTPRHPSRWQRAAVGTDPIAPFQNRSRLAYKIESLASMPSFRNLPGRTN